MKKEKSKLMQVILVQLEVFGLVVKKKMVKKLLMNLMLRTN